MFRNEQGFTLIEIIVALVILTVVAVPLSHILLQGNQLAEHAEKKTAALNVAQQKMEEIIAQGYVRDEDAGTFFSEEGFSCSVTLSPDVYLVLVTVAVSYSVSGSEKTVSLSALLPAGE
jgi:prepilin-type N-terminal cleavage/methylation domain-containing protein